MTFVGIQIARAEQDGEDGHPGGDPETDHVIGPGRRNAGQRLGSGGADDAIAGRHGLQLQGDVRRCTDHGDQRDQRREPGTLAVA